MGDIHLFDYQLDMVCRIHEAFRTHSSLMVQMPMGTGKTHVIASVVSDVLSSHAGDVWIVAHRCELVRQVEATVRAFGMEPVSAGNPGGRVRVMSIQWLSHHLVELASLAPALLVIDEAHHAVAQTYKVLLEAFPAALRLGVTATPCRLSGRGFTDLFEVLLQSWPIGRFIAAGRLAPYDYLSVMPDGEEQLAIGRLRGRGADGDFSTTELSALLDIRPSVERLRDSVLRYAAGRKGIVYAIDIRHAEHIAACYREGGIPAEVVSSHTSSELRRTLLERFRLATTMENPSVAVSMGDGRAAEVRVLVSVDLFSEGFDCPDVAFIQLARPTLSLSRYLQMVGRGLRVHSGKQCCLILDNVGSYRLFGFPSAPRDWQAMFEGRVPGGVPSPSSVPAEILPMRVEMGRTSSNWGMVTLITHGRLLAQASMAHDFRVIVGADGRQGVMDGDGNELLSPIYNKVELQDGGFAQIFSRRRADRELPWVDLVNGVRFRVRPHVETIGGWEMSTQDGLRLYPRVRTRLMDGNSYVTPQSVGLVSRRSLRFRGLYLHDDMEGLRLYVVKECVEGLLLLADRHSRLYWQRDELGMEEATPTPVDMAGWEDMRHRQADRRRRLLTEARSLVAPWRWRSPIDGVAAGRGGVDGDILHLRQEDREAWVDLRTKAVYLRQPECFRVGFLHVAKVGEAYFVRNAAELYAHPFLADDLLVRGSFCLLGRRYILLGEEPGAGRLYTVVRRNIDNMHFEVTYQYGRLYRKEAVIYFDGVHTPTVKDIDPHKD